MHLSIMRDCFLILAIIGVAACGPRSNATASPIASTDSVMLPEPLIAPAADLSGSWYTGNGAEPEVKVIQLYPSCAVVPAAWLIEQKENALKAWMFPERFNQGIRRANENMARIAPATGIISGDDVVLSDESYRWRLKYDSVSGHLRGTRNGERFWAVRQAVIRMETCLPPPAR